MQLRLTLDTNSIIYAFDEKHETPVELDEVHAIIRHALGGKVNLALTTAMSRDLEGDTDDGRRAKLLNAVSMFPAIGAPARFGVTRYDAGDVLASDTETEVGKRVQSIVFPAGIDTDSKRWKNKANDVDHLVAHWRERRDVFVTTDAPILRRAGALQGELGIRVAAPVDALDLVERTVNVALIAEDYLSRFAQLTDLLQGVLQTGSKEVTPEIQQQYEDLRSWLLRAWPKIQRPMGEYRLHRIQTPAPGGQVMVDRLKLAALNDDPNPFQQFYGRESAVATVHDLREWGRRYGRGTAAVQYVHDRAEECRTLLTGFTGFLESNAP